MARGRRGAGLHRSCVSRCSGVRLHGLGRFPLLKVRSPHTTLQLVVVETALNTAHGSAHGNEICRQDCLTFAHAAAPGSHEQVRCGAARGAGIGRA